ncbi:MAG: hypothetical protein ACI4QI_06530 [Candidatus Coproplasma sp.]
MSANRFTRLQLTHKTVEEKKDIMFKEINFSNKCRIFYSKDRAHIVYIFKRDDGFYSIGAERLTLADDEEIVMYKTYGWWEPESIRKSIYETEEIAYCDIKNAIADYEELIF